MADLFFSLSIEPFRLKRLPKFARSLLSFVCLTLALPAFSDRASSCGCSASDAARFTSSAAWPSPTLSACVVTLRPSPVDAMTSSSRTAKPPLLESGVMRSVLSVDLSTTFCCCWKSDVEPLRENERRPKLPAITSMSSACSALSMTSSM